MPPDADLARLLRNLDPDETALWDWVRARLNDSIVREIAAFDHGMNVDEYRRGIKEVRTTRHLLEELPWVPRAVLNLASHMQLTDPPGAPGSAGWRGHVARLFACVVLTAANDQDAPAETLACLVDSAVQFGPEVTQLAVRYLAWCRLHEPGTWRDEPDVRPFLTLGLLVLTAAGPGPGDPAVASALTAAFVREADPVTLKSAVSRSCRRIWRHLLGPGLTDEDVQDRLSPH